MPISVEQSIIIIAICVGCTILERGLPFLILFAKLSSTLSPFKLEVTTANLILEVNSTNIIIHLLSVIVLLLHRVPHMIRRYQTCLTINT